MRTCSDLERCINDRALLLIGLEGSNRIRSELSVTRSAEGWVAKILTHDTHSSNLITLWLGDSFEDARQIAEADDLLIPPAGKDGKDVRWLDILNPDYISSTKGIVPGLVDIVPASKSRREKDLLIWIPTRDFATIDNAIAHLHLVGAVVPIAKAPVGLTLGESRVVMAHDEGTGIGKAFAWFTIQALSRQRDGRLLLVGDKVEIISLRCIPYGRFRSYRWIDLDTILNLPCVIYREKNPVKNRSDVNWTAEEEAALLKAANGCTCKARTFRQFAEEHGRTFHAVSYKFHQSRQGRTKA